MPRKNVIYCATVEKTAKTQKETSTEDNRPSTDAPRFYIGLTSLEFKKRHQNHKSTLNKKEKREATELSKYVWEIKDNKIEHSITWSILTKVSEKSNGRKSCRLCDMEMLKILEHKKKYGNRCLNKRKEIANACRHKRKRRLKAWRWRDEDQE